MVTDHPPGHIFPPFFFSMLFCLVVRILFWFGFFFNLLLHHMWKQLLQEESIALASVSTGSADSASPPGDF